MHDQHIQSDIAVTFQKISSKYVGVLLSTLLSDTKGLQVLIIFNGCYVTSQNNRLKPKSSQFLDGQRCYNIMTGYHFHSTVLIWLVFPIETNWSFFFFSSIKMTNLASQMLHGTACHMSTEAIQVSWLSENVSVTSKGWQKWRNLQPCEWLQIDNLILPEHFPFPDDWSYCAIHQVICFHSVLCPVHLNWLLPYIIISLFCFWSPSFYFPSVRKLVEMH